jgi:hypothetical protein
MLRATNRSGEGLAAARKWDQHRTTLFHESTSSIVPNPEDHVACNEHVRRRLSRGQEEGPAADNLVSRKLEGLFRHVSTCLFFCVYSRHEFRAAQPAVYIDEAVPVQASETSTHARAALWMSRNV